MSRLALDRLGGDREDVPAPGRQVEKEAPRDQIASVAIVTGGAEQIVKMHGAPGEIGPWEAHVALALVPGVVDYDECSLTIASLPAPGDAAVPRPVAIPSRHAIEKVPLAIRNGRMAENRKQVFVEALQCFIDRLPWRANEMRRDALPPSVELALMKEPQTRGGARCSR